MEQRTHAFFFIFGLAAVIALAVSCAIPAEGTDAPAQPQSPDFVPDIKDMGDHYLVDGDIVIDKSNPGSAAIADQIARANRVAPASLPEGGASGNTTPNLAPQAPLKSNFLTGAGNVLRCPTTNIRYCISGDLSVPGFPHAAAVDALKAAFSEWASHSNLTFTEVPWVDAPNFFILAQDLSSRGANGLCRYWYNDLGAICKAEISVSTATTWESAAYLKDVWMHEIGHGLGLAHEHQRADSPYRYGQPIDGLPYWNYDAASIMNYGRPHDATLTAGDVAAVQYLYMRDDHYFQNLAGDYNGDGRDDILRVVDSFHLNELYLADPAGGFSAAPAFNIKNTWLGHSNRTFGSMSADFSGDGATDILRWCNDYSCNELYVSNRDGSFTASPAFNVKNTWVAHNNNSFGSFVADFTGDGAADILRWCNDYTCNELFVSNRDGSFTASPAFNVKNTWIAHNNNTFGSIIADFNGDGAADILRWCNEYTCNALFLSNRDGSFTNSTAFNINNTWIAHNNQTFGSLIGDFNGDGAADILRVCNEYSCNALYLSNRNGSFTNSPAFNVYDTWIFHSNRTFGSYIGDFDGDGDDDILRYCDSYSCHVLYLSDGDGSFTPSTAFNIADTWLTHTNASVGSFLGDFNGDGAMDIMTRWWPSQANILRLSRRDGSFGAERAYNVIM